MILRKHPLALFRHILAKQRLLNAHFQGYPN